MMKVGYSGIQTLPKIKYSNNQNNIRFQGLFKSKDSQDSYYSDYYEDSQDNWLQKSKSFAKSCAFVLLFGHLAYNTVNSIFIWNKANSKEVIPVENLVSEIHEKGLTGKNIKVGIIVKEGLVPNEKIKNENIINSKIDKEKEIKALKLLCTEHDETTASIIASALPDAKIICMKSGDTITGYEMMKKYYFDTAKSVINLVDSGVDVINISEGLNVYSIFSDSYNINDNKTIAKELENIIKPLKEAVKYAKSKNIPVVVSAGNDSTINKHTTKELASAFKIEEDELQEIIDKYGTMLFGSLNMIMVGSMDKNGKKIEASDFTSEGTPEYFPDISAFGDGTLQTYTIPTSNFPNLYTAINTSDVIFRNSILHKGTSYSTPFVTSVIGLMKEANPNLTVEDIEDILINTAKNNDTSRIYRCGSGLIDPEEAVEKALEKNQKILHRMKNIKL